jgi:chemotaxis protein MotA
VDLATIIGIFGALAFVVMAMIQGGDIAMFVNLPGIFIVFGGSLFVVLSQYTLGQFLGAGKIAGKAFMFKTDPLESQIEKIVKMAISA